MSEKEIEKEIQEKGLTAPRLTPDLIDSKIKSVEFHVFDKTMLTVCCMTLENGFTVTGESACASPENFNAEIGEKIAKENARNKIWALEGYLLKQRLFEAEFAARNTCAAPTFQQRVMSEKAELDEKLTALDDFIERNSIFKTLPAHEQQLMCDQYSYMRDYSIVLGERIANFK